MMESNSIVTSTQGTAKSTTTSSTQSSSEFKNEDFMKLLLAQLKYQNPLEPMKDQEFMSQLTQLNSLNILKSIDTNMQKLSQQTQMSNAASLIEKTVEYLASDGSTKSGVVSSVSVDGNNILIQVNGEKILLSNVKQITS